MKFNARDTIPSINNLKNSFFSFAEIENGHAFSLFMHSWAYIIFFAKLCHIHYQYYFTNGHIEKMKYEIPLNTGTGMKKISIEKCPSPKEELINPK